MGANSSAPTLGNVLFDEFVKLTTYMKDGPIFVRELQGVVVDHGIDAILSACDDAQVFMKEHESELGVPVLTSLLATTLVCRSKMRTYSALEGLVRCSPASAYPLFVKPDTGEGSRGCQVVQSPAELGAYLESSAETIVVSELLIGDEFTVDCFTGRDRQLLFCSARQRCVARSGISIVTQLAAQDVQQLTRSMAGIIHTIPTGSEEHQNYLLRPRRHPNNTQRATARERPIFTKSAEEKQLVLMTWHSGNVTTMLDAVRLAPSLFDEIVHVTGGEPKSQYIREPATSVLLDDSFQDCKDAIVHGVLEALATNSL